jgi:hypothetical protein
VDGVAEAMLNTGRAWRVGEHSTAKTG